MKNTMSEATRSTLARDLNGVLADTYVLYNVTQHHHWNVTGDRFRSLHQMFEEQYEDLAQAIDVLAERVRILGTYPDASPAFLSEKSRSWPWTEPTQDTAKMLRHLIVGHEQLAESLTELIGQAEEARDFATADLLTERLRIHEKTRWMLESQAGRQGRLLEGRAWSERPVAASV